MGRVLSLVLAAALCARAVSASVLAPGFQESVVFAGRESPVAVRFAPNGQVFVAEKSGRVFVYASLADTSPTQVVDLRASVYNYWDRGLLGLAVHPDYPNTPYVYVFYAHDTWPPGDPRFGDPDAAALRSGRAEPGHRRSVLGSDGSGLRRLWPALSDRDQPGDHQGHRGGHARRQLVPAVPESLRGRPGLRRRWLPLRERRRRRLVRIHGRRSVRRARESLRRSARRCRGSQRSAQRGGRRSAQPGHPDARRSDRLQRVDPAPRRQRAAPRGRSRQPADRQRRSGRRPDRGDRAAKSLPHDAPSRDRRDLDRRRRLVPVGGDRSPGHDHR